MGLIRTLLALSVVDFHWAFTIHGPGGKGFWLFGMPNGVVAVQAFYIISGFYMSLVLDKKYHDKPLLFYRARLLRLWPTYWIVAVSTLGLLWATKASYFGAIPRSPFGAAWYVFSNATLVGQDWNVFLQIPDILPQAWTLGVEITFYAFAPFLARCRTRSLAALLAASVTARVAAYAHGLYDDPWSYRFFPFEFAWFLAGMLAHRTYAFGYSRRPMLMKAGGTVAIISVLFVILDFSAILATGRPLPAGYVNTSAYTLQFLLVAALPFVFALTKDSRVDNFIGEFSYPIYISHFLILTFVLPPANSLYRAEKYFATVLGCSLLLLVITKPIERWRERATEKRLQRSNGSSRIATLPPLIQSKEAIPTPVFVAASSSSIPTS